MLRVPGGRRRSLLEAKARGADVRTVYSPLDALALAQREPEREVVFFGVGFETTAPATALTLQRARALGVRNFSVFCNHVLIGPALRAILDSPDTEIDGFVGPGHVSTVIGTRPTSSSAASTGGRSSSPASSRPTSCARSRCCWRQLREGRAEVENQYGRVVRAGGQPARRSPRWARLRRAPRLRVARPRRDPAQRPADRRRVLGVGRRAALHRPGRCGSRIRRRAAAATCCAAAPSRTSAASSARRARRSSRSAPAWSRARAPAPPTTRTAGTAAATACRRERRRGDHARATARAARRLAASSRGSSSRSCATRCSSRSSDAAVVGRERDAARRHDRLLRRPSAPLPRRRHRRARRQRHGQRPRRLGRRPARADRRLRARGRLPARRAAALLVASMAAARAPRRCRRGGRGHQGRRARRRRRPLRDDGRESDCSTFAPCSGSTASGPATACWSPAAIAEHGIAVHARARQPRARARRRERHRSPERARRGPLLARPGAALDARPDPRRPRDDPERARGAARGSPSPSTSRRCRCATTFAQPASCSGSTRCTSRTRASSSPSSRPEAAEEALAAPAQAHPLGARAALVGELREDASRSSSPARRSAPGSSTCSSATRCRGSADRGGEEGARGEPSVPRLRSGHEAGPSGLRRGGRPCRLAELAQDVRHVAVHGVLAEDERRGDLAVREPLGHEAQHLRLAPAERGAAVRLDRLGVAEETGERAAQVSRDRRARRRAHRLRGRRSAHSAGARPARGRARSARCGRPGGGGRARARDPGKERPQVGEEVELEVGGRDLRLCRGAEVAREPVDLRRGSPSGRAGRRTSVSRAASSSGRSRRASAVVASGMSSRAA